MTFPLLHFPKDVKLIIVHANKITDVRDQISNCIPSLNIKEQRFAILMHHIQGLVNIFL